MNPRLTVAAGAATLLASLALSPLLWGWHWFVYGAGAVMMAGAVGIATRVRTLPVVVCLAAAVAGEFVYLNAVFAGARSWGGLVPTASSLHRLNHLLVQARGEMSHYSPPVPDGRGILLLVCAGIGLVAVMTDLLAVRLRRPALAGLPLLILFCVPLTTDAHPSWLGGTLVFCLGMAGYLALLSADARERLRLWGRLVHRWHDEPEGRAPDTRPLSAAGRRIGLAAVVIALFLPLLVPGLKQHRLFSGSGSGGGHGYHGQISLPNPLDELNKELHEGRPQTVLTYRTADPQPPYLQVYVLSALGTRAWTMAPPKVTYELRKGNLPVVPGLAPGTAGTTLREDISLGSGLTSRGTNLSYLPLPYAARTVKVDGTWRVDPTALTVLASGAKLAGLHYTVTADDVNPAAAQLRSAPSPPGWLAPYLDVPQEFQGLSRLAHRVTARRTTAYGKALELQNWFTQSGNFTYSLNVPPAGSPNALVQFLKHTKHGYCQQFAFAMAVLARLLDIPSRVVVGYTQGTYFNGYWQVKTSDAHAWPELYFAGAGWLRFEPTPAGSPGHPGQATASAPAYSIPPSLTGQTGDPALPRGQGLGGVTRGASPPPGVFVGKLSHSDTGAGPGGARRARGSSEPAGIAVLALLAVVLVTPRTARSLTRRVRWLRATDDAQRAHAAWREVRDDLTDYRFDFRASESPRALADRAARALRLPGEQREALARIAFAEERASYAMRPADSGTLARDVATARRAVARSSSPAARCSAVLLPRSALAPARTALQNALDVFGWIDVITSKARRPGRHRESAAVS